MRSASDEEVFKSMAILALATRGRAALNDSHHCYINSLTRIGNQPGSDAIRRIASGIKHTQT